METGEWEMTPDELWGKYSSPETQWTVDGKTAVYCEHALIRRLQFLAALAEYGELVKAEAVKVCDDEKDNHVMSKYARVDDCRNARLVARSCAAAIKEMKLP